MAGRKKAPTLAELRKEARRVFGPDAVVGTNTTRVFVSRSAHYDYLASYFATAKLSDDGKRFLLAGLRVLPTRKASQ